MNSSLALVHHGGHAAWAVEAALDYHIVYLHMIGARESVRAIWAALIQGMRIQIGDSTAGLDMDMDCLRFSRRLPSGGYQMVLVHPMASVRHLGTRAALKEGIFHAYVRGDGNTPPSLFIPFLDKLIRAPALPSWALFLWKQGLTQRLITPLETPAGSVPWWALKADEDGWRKLISEGIKGGEIWQGRRQ